jgi:hypothetical protein
MGASFSSSRRVEMVIRPPSIMASQAFLTRLMITCCRLLEFPQTGGQASSNLWKGNVLNFSLTLNQDQGIFNHP